MTLLAITLVGFVLVHTAMSRPWLRDPLTARLGRGGYGAANGVVSLAGIAIVFWAYHVAPYIELWPSSPVVRSFPVVIMPFACILAVAGLSTPCAGLRGDRLPEGDNPAPGILGITRHPIPVAIAVWAAAHLVANGDLAATLLFGTFFAFAAIAPRLVDDRRARLCGGESWSRFAAATSVLPFTAAVAGRTAIDWRGIGWTRMVVGLGLYFLLIAMHQWVIGVPAAPGFHFGKF